MDILQKGAPLKIFTPQPGSQGEPVLDYYDENVAKVTPTVKNPNGVVTPPAPTEPPALTHSWDQKAKEVAGIQFKKDITTAAQDNIANRQNVENQIGQGQAQVVMSKYSAGQNIERAGWAGGYALDTRRQSEYLKQSIAAQLYGSLELQKLGFESQLSAARLAYDLGKEQLAQQLYQQEYENSISEAQITGVMFSPQVRDMLSQQQAAEAILAQYEADGALPLGNDYNHAVKVLEQIDAWFLESGLSKEGVKTLAKYELELNQQLADQSMIRAAVESMLPGQWLMTDGTGQYVKDANGQLQIIDLTSADTASQLNLFTTSQNGARALKSQVDSLATQTITNFLQLQGAAGWDDAAFATYIASGSNDLVKAYLTKFTLDGHEDAQGNPINMLDLIAQLAPEMLSDGQYVKQITKDGKTYTYSYGEAGASGGDGDVIPGPVNPNSSGTSSTTPFEVVDNLGNTVQADGLSATNLNKIDWSAGDNVRITAGNNSNLELEVNRTEALYHDGSATEAEQYMNILLRMPSMTEGDMVVCDGNLYMMRDNGKLVKLEQAEISSRGYDGSMMSGEAAYNFVKAQVLASQGGTDANTWEVDLSSVNSNASTQVTLMGGERLLSSRDNATLSFNGKEYLVERGQLLGNLNLGFGTGTERTHGLWNTAYELAKLAGSTASYPQNKYSPITQEDVPQGTIVFYNGNFWWRTGAIDPMNAWAVFENVESGDYASNYTQLISQYIMKNYTAPRPTTTGNPGGHQVE